MNFFQQRPPADNFAFDSSKHPRGDDGKFGKGGGESKGKSSSVRNEEYTKGAQRREKLKASGTVRDEDLINDVLAEFPHLKEPGIDSKAEALKFLADDEKHLLEIGDADSTRRKSARDHNKRLNTTVIGKLRKLLGAKERTDYF